MRLSRLLSLLACSTIAAAPVAAQQSTQTIAALLKRPVDAQRMLAAGDTKTGALTDASPSLSDSSRAELWYFRGTKGQRVSVRQRSEDFDTFVHVGLHGADEPAVQNDDAGDDGVNAGAELTLPSDGVYVIIANAFDGSGRGAYTVSLEVREPAPGMSGPMTPATVTLREPEATQRLAFGQRFGSQLDARDEKMDDGTPFELWFVTAAAGDTISVSVANAEFPVALHAGPQGSGQVLSEAGGAAPVSVQFVAPASGSYAIVVRGARADAAGSYMLELTKAAGSR